MKRLIKSLLTSHLDDLDYWNEMTYEYKEEKLSREILKESTGNRTITVDYEYGDDKLPIRILTIEKHMECLLVDETEQNISRLTLSNGNIIEKIQEVKNQYDEFHQDTAEEYGGCVIYKLYDSLNGNVLEEHTESGERVDYLFNTYDERGRIKDVFSLEQTCHYNDDIDSFEVHWCMDHESHSYTIEEDTETEIITCSFLQFADKGGYPIVIDDFVVDDEGFFINRGVKHYVIDAEAKEVSIAKTVTKHCDDCDTIVTKYDSKGELIETIETKSNSGGSLVVTKKSDGDVCRVEEFDADGNILTRQYGPTVETYEYQDFNLKPKSKQSIKRHKRRDSNDELEEWIKSWLK